MIYDCFPFFQELDLLEIRLNTLRNIVDTFVVVELNVTHSGKPKDFVLKENWERFNSFPIYYVMLEPQEALVKQGSWKIENWHRRQLKICLEDLEPTPTDIIILSDLDEIPDPKLISEHRFGRYVQKQFYFHLNTFANQSWPSGTIVVPNIYTQAIDFQALRIDKNLSLINDAGWHFSSVGTYEDVMIKMESFAHTEFDNEDEKWRVTTNYFKGKGIWNENLTVLPINEAYPQYLQDTWRTKWRHLIYEPVCSI